MTDWLGEKAQIMKGPREWDFKMSFIAPDVLQSARSIPFTVRVDDVEVEVEVVIVRMQHSPNAIYEWDTGSFWRFDAYVSRWPRGSYRVEYGTAFLTAMYDYRDGGKGWFEKFVDDPSELATA